MFLFFSAENENKRTQSSLLSRGRQLMLKASEQSKSGPPSGEVEFSILARRKLKVTSVTDFESILKKWCPKSKSVNPLANTSFQQDHNRNQNKHRNLFNLLHVNKLTSSNKTSTTHNHHCDDKTWSCCHVLEWDEGSRLLKDDFGSFHDKSNCTDRQEGSSQVLQSNQQLNLFATATSSKLCKDVSSPDRIAEPNIDTTVEPRRGDSKFRAKTTNKAVHSHKKIITLSNSFYIKVEDGNNIYAPLVRKFVVFPKITFDSKSLLSISNLSSKSISSKSIGSKSIDIQLEKQSIKQRNIIDRNDQKKENSRNLLNSRTFLSKPKSKKFPMTKYCECCDVHYTNLNTHLSTHQHKTYTNNENNFICIDTEIAKLKSIYELRKVSQNSKNRKKSTKEKFAVQNSFVLAEINVTTKQCLNVLTTDSVANMAGDIAPSNVHFTSTKPAPSLYSTHFNGSTGNYEYSHTDNSETNVGDLMSVDLAKITEAFVSNFNTNSHDRIKRKQEHLNIVKTEQYDKSAPDEQKLRNIDKLDLHNINKSSQYNIDKSEQQSADAQDKLSEILLFTPSDSAADNSNQQRVNANQITVSTQHDKKQNTLLNLRHDNTVRDGYSELSDIVSYSPVNREVGLHLKSRGRMSQIKNDIKAHYNKRNCNIRNDQQLMSNDCTTNENQSYHYLLPKKERQCAALLKNKFYLNRIKGAKQSKGRKLSGVTKIGTKLKYKAFVAKGSDKFPLIIRPDMYSLTYSRNPHKQHSLLMLNKDTKEQFFDSTSLTDRRSYSKKERASHQIELDVPMHFDATTTYLAQVASYNPSQSEAQALCYYSSLPTGKNLNCIEPSINSYKREILINEAKENSYNASLRDERIKINYAFGKDYEVKLNHRSLDIVIDSNINKKDYVSNKDIICDNDIINDNGPKNDNNGIKDSDNLNDKATAFDVQLSDIKLQKNFINISKSSGSANEWKIILSNDLKMTLRRIQT